MSESEFISFEISPSSGVPIYRQLIEQVRRMIASNHLSPGDLMPSVRLLASQLAVNPMTISKAYSLLEAEGLLERQRGKGMIVSNQQPKALSTQQRLDLLQPAVDKLVCDTRQLDLEIEKVIEVIRKTYQQK